MAESKPPSGAENASAALNPDVIRDAKAAKPPRPPNPIYKYMGLVIYDKREKRRVQRKWCKLVEHVAKEPLDPKSMPRKLTIFLEGPPTDGLRVAQDHFKEYVKPILVASGLDWEFIQGRKEGDIRAELAEKIRNSRLPPGQRTVEDPIAEARNSGGITEFEGPRGDIVLGRHTWKEYVRGVHEGWLGPLTEPPKLVEELENAETNAEAPMETLPGITILSTPRDADAPSAAAETPAPDAEKLKKPPQPAPFISTSDYTSAITPPDLPIEFDPSTPISFPHILGFLNTPKRLYRFLNRRVLADSIGRETAAIILSTYRPYNTISDPRVAPAFSDDQEDSPQSKSQNTAQIAEQQTALIEEEKEWHKNARKRVDGEPERTWLEPVVLDPRIAARMRRFELSAEDEVRARGIVVPEEDIEGWIKGGLRSLGRQAMQTMGFAKEKRPDVGDDDEEVLS